MIKPDFNHGLINLSATLAQYIGDKNDIVKLPIVEAELKKNYKNVVFIIFDGLGKYNVDLLKKSGDYYSNNMVDVISSTMPATTTNATTTLISTLYPNEHQWLAWSLFLKDINRVVKIYLNKDYYTNEQVKPYPKKYQSFLDRANSERHLVSIAPNYVHYSDRIKMLPGNNLDELFSSLQNVLDEDANHFIYCYCDMPDSHMHDFGVASNEVKKDYTKINDGIKKLIEDNKNLLIITTADHGHIDVKKRFDIYKDLEIMSLLSRPMSWENRFASFKLKEGKAQEFKEKFNEKYKEYFELVSVDEFINQEIFGPNKNELEMREFIGDFIAIGNDKFGSFNFFDDPNPLKGQHAGGSKQEMEVPLCIFKSEQ